MVNWPKPFLDRKEEETSRRKLPQGHSELKDGREAEKVPSSIWPEAVGSQTLAHSKPASEGIRKLGLGPVSLSFTQLNKRPFGKQDPDRGRGCRHPITPQPYLPHSVQAELAVEAESGWL